MQKVISTKELARFRHLAWLRGDMATCALYDTAAQDRLCHDAEKYEQYLREHQDKVLFPDIN